MLKEFHHDGRFAWPDDAARRGDADLRFPGRRGRAAARRTARMDHEEYTQCEYGPHTGDLADPAHSRRGGRQGDVPHLRRRSPSAIPTPSRPSSPAATRSPATATITRSRATSRASRKPRYAQDRRHDPRPRRHAAGGMALMHAEPQQPRTPDGAWISVEQQFVLARPAVPVGSGRPRSGRAAAPAVRRRPHLSASQQRRRQPARHAGDLEGMFDEFHDEVEARADLLSVPVPPVHFRPARARRTRCARSSST